MNSDGSTLAVSPYLEKSMATGMGGNQLDGSGFQAGAVDLY